jgi:hypothetical protein
VRADLSGTKSGLVTQVSLNGELLIRWSVAEAFSRDYGTMTVNSLGEGSRVMAGAKRRLRMTGHGLRTIGDWETEPLAGLVDFEAGAKYLLARGYR